MNVGRVRGQSVLSFVLALVKCTRIYFAGANNAPWLLAHLKHCSWRLCSILQLSLVVSPKARAFTSSTKPIPVDGEAGRLQALTEFAF